MKKRTLISIIICLGIIMLMIPSAAADAGISVNTDSDEVDKGETVRIEIESDIAGVRGMQLSFIYDFGRFSLKSVEKAEILQDASVAVIDTDTYGRINIASVFDSSFDAKGGICSIVLECRPEAAGGETGLTVKNISVTSDDKESVNYEPVTKSIIIASDEAPTEQPMPSESTGEEPTGQPTPAAETARPNGDAHKGASGGGHSVSPATATPAAGVGAPNKDTSDKNTSDSGTTEQGGTAAPKTIFLDLKNHWAEGDINYLYDKGIVEGVSETMFEPERSITRAEFVKLISGITELKEPGENVFTDVEPGDWYYDVVLRAYASGVVNGYDNKFLPDDCITREEMAVIVSRCLDMMNISSDNGGSTVTFDDEAEFSYWSRGAIDKIAYLGIINGIDNSFMPKSDTTRAQAAVVIKRVYEVKEE